MDATRKSNRYQLIRDTGYLWIGNIIEMVLSAIRSLFVPGWLGPKMYGVIGALNITTQYGRHLDLGVNTAMSREVPQYSARSEVAQALEYGKATLAFNLITSSIPALAMIVFAFFMWDFYGWQVFWGVLAYAAILILTRLDIFYQLYLKSVFKFNNAGVGIFIRAVVSFALVIVLTYFYGFYGYLIATLAGFAATVIYLVMVGGLPLSVIPQWRYLKPLIKGGLPLFIIALGGILLQTIDRLMVVKYYGAVNMGYYALAVLIMNFIYMLPNLAGQAMATRIYGIPRGGDRTRFNDYIIKPTLLMTTSVALLGGFALITLIPLVSAFLPAYDPTPPVLAPLLIGSTCLGGAHAAGYILIALKKIRTIGIIQIISFIVAFIFIRLAIQFRLGLAGVAAGGAAGLTTYAILLQLSAVRQTGSGLGETIKSVIYLLVPPAFVAVALAIAFFFSGPIVYATWLPSVEIVKDLYFFVVRAVIFAVLAAPIVWYTERRVEIIRTIWTGLKEKFAIEDDKVI